jgi:hypothetical protein
MPRSFYKHRKEPKNVRSQKTSQWQNRRRENLTKLISKSIMTCDDLHSSELQDCPSIAICSRNVRHVTQYITENIIGQSFLKRYLVEESPKIKDNCLFRTLSKYSKIISENTTKKLKEWSMSAKFFEDFCTDYYHSCEIFQDFTVGCDLHYKYSSYYKYECNTYKNELEWFFSLYTDWKNVVRCENTKYYLIKFSDWFNDVNRTFPMPLPSKRGFYWYNVEKLIQHVFRNIVEKYETDMKPIPEVHYAAFSNYFLTQWVNSHLHITTTHTNYCIRKYLPFPDKIVVISRRYFRLLSLGGMIQKLLENISKLPGTSYTISRFTKRTLVNYVTGSELLFIIQNDKYSFPHYWARWWR